jgi:hypothetical protein
MKKRKKTEKDGLLSAPPYSPEASTSGFRDSPRSPPSVDALGYVPAPDKYGTFLYFFNGIQTRRPSGAIRPEYRILARWRRPVASREALDPLYRSMSAVSYRRISSSVETAWMEVHSFVVDNRAIDLNLAY